MTLTAVIMCTWIYYKNFISVYKNVLILRPVKLQNDISDIVSVTDEKFCCWFILNICNTIIIIYLKQKNQRIVWLFTTLLWHYFSVKQGVRTCLDKSDLYAMLNIFNTLNLKKISSLLYNIYKHLYETKAIIPFFH